MFSFDNKTFWAANLVWDVAKCYLCSLVWFI